MHLRCSESWVQGHLKERFRGGFRYPQPILEGLDSCSGLTSNSSSLWIHILRSTTIWISATRNLYWVQVSWCHLGPALLSVGFRVLNSWWKLSPCHLSAFQIERYLALWAVYYNAIHIIPSLQMRETRLAGISEAEPHQGNCTVWCFTVAFVHSHKMR